MTIFSCRDIPLKITNVNLTVALDDRSGVTKVSEIHTLSFGGISEIFQSGQSGVE